MTKEEAEFLCPYDIKIRMGMACLVIILSTILALIVGLSTSSVPKSLVILGLGIFILFPKEREC